MEILGRTEDGKQIIAILSEDEVDILESGYDKPYESLTLPYEHVGQNSPGAYQNRNDCGSACVCSCARSNGYPTVSVDEISAKYQRKNKAMYIYEVQNALTGYEMKNAHHNALFSKTIKEHLRIYEKPIIALVHYPDLPYNAIPYKYSHYILMYGYEGDDTFLYHDPLSDGRLLTITSDQLNAALAGVRQDGNKPNQGIILLT